MRTGEISAYDGTKGKRREARQRVRNILGTSSDVAPNARRAFRAASQLDMLIRDATAGEFTLQLTRNGAAVDWPVAQRECDERGVWG